MSLPDPLTQTGPTPPVTPTSLTVETPKTEEVAPTIVTPPENQGGIPSWLLEYENEKGEDENTTPETP